MSSTNAANPGRLFAFGLGYSARTLARDALAEGWRVAGTCRRPDKRAALAAQGLETFLFDRGRPLDDPAHALDGTTHLLTSVPPDADGDPVLDHHGADILAIPGLQWVGYLSTTGVYGDRDGDWVDETDEVRPTGPRQCRRVAAERRWLDLCRDHGLPVRVFRLAGIYGPGRSALDSVRDGTARRIDKPGQMFSRIHVDDLSTILRASMAQGQAGAIYNVCDDEPAPGHAVVTYACRLLGVEPPPLLPFATADLTPMARSFYADNKRVRNDRIKRDLGIRFKHPDYRSGLEAQLAAEKSSG